MSTELWAEVWTRPGHPTPGRVLDFVPSRSAWIEGGINKIGAGNFVLPNSFEHFDDLLYTDLANTANSKSSLVRWYSALDPVNPIHEWLPSEIIPDGEKGSTTTKVTGVGINGVLGYARLEPYDWDGTDDFAPSQPDWEWGANNLLGNWDFESNQVTNQTYTLEITATGGTFTITDGTDTTDPIPVTGTPSTDMAAIEAALQDDITAITDVAIDVAGTSPNTYNLLLFTPPFGVALTLSGLGSLTGGTATLTQTEAGGLSPSPWVPNQQIVFGVTQDAGNYDAFEVSDDQNHTPGGTYSLLIDPSPPAAASNRNLGAQQTVSVTPGAIYQASIWVYPTSNVTQFRLGLFTESGEFIASTTYAGQTLAANVWSQLVISDVLMPDNVNTVIFKIQCLDRFPTSPAPFYVDDAEFYPGLAPTTIGEILRLIFEHATDPTLRTPIVWDDGQGTNTPYITLDFDDVNDSNGVPWADTEIRTRLTMRMSYSQIMASLVSEYRYEYRIVPDDPEQLTYLWQVYNPGTMDDLPDVAIQGGASDTTRSLRRLTPEGTDQMVEGLDRVTSRARNAGLVAALGRIEASTLSREAPDLVATAAAAASAAAVAAVGIESIAYDLVDPQDEPLTVYRPGDTVTVVDPPDITALATRFVEYGATITPERVEWSTQFGRATTINPEAAVASAVSGLLTKFEYPFPDPKAAALQAGEGGGTPTITVAPANSSEWSKGKADFKLTGNAADDLFALQTAADELALTGGRLVVTEGGADIGDGQLVLPGDVHLMGMNRWDGTTISGTNPAGIISVSDDCTISDLTVRELGCSPGATGIVGPGADNVTIRNVRLFTLTVGIAHGGDNWVVEDVSASILATFIESTAGHDHLRIENCTTAGLIDITDVSYVSIVGNQLGSLVELGAGSIINIVANTYFNPGGAGTHLVHADGATGVVYAANTVLEADGYNGVLFENCPQPLIAVNTFGDVTEGVRVDGCDGAKIVGNTIGATPALGGQYLGGTGIWVQDSNDVTVTDNTVVEPGQDTDDTFYGVALAGTTTDAHVTDNKVVSSTAANQTRSGVAVGVGVTCAVVVSNSLGDPAGYGTDALEDFGTNTQLFYPSDPIYGDNFTGCAGGS